MESWNKERHIFIGTRSGWSDSKPFGISLSDHRFHIYVIGKTGSGKTTLLRNLLAQHIALGHGIGLIDPHGDLAEDILNFIPPRRADDLIYFNPADLEHPLAMNLLAGVAPDDRPLVASAIVNACKSIWADSWGPRLEYILYNAIAALLECQNTSLLGVNRLLTDSEYRAWVIRQIKDPFIRDFWANEYENYDPRFQREAIAPIQNKLGQFLLHPAIRNILGQVKRKVDVSIAMNEGQIFVANLAKGKLGHDKANLLGSLLVAQFQQAAMARANLAEDERRDFVLFIDEFQNFSTEAFASILAEARKYRLSLVLSHQFIEQIVPIVRQAILGNVGTIICFRVGWSDAEIIEKAFGKEIIAQQLVDLPRYHVGIQLCENGESRYPFQATMLPPIDQGVGRKDELIARSRERFTTPRAEVEEKLNRWLQIAEPEIAINRPAQKRSEKIPSKEIPNGMSIDAHRLPPTSPLESLGGDTSLRRKH